MKTSKLWVGVHEYCYVTSGNTEMESPIGNAFALDSSKSNDRLPTGLWFSRMIKENFKGSPPHSFEFHGDL